MLGLEGLAADPSSAPGAELMPFLPFNILGVWFRGLFAFAIIAAGIYLLREWHEDSWIVETVPNLEKAETPQTKVTVERRAYKFEPGWNLATAELAGGIFLLGWATVGALVRRAVSMAFGGPKANAKARGMAGQGATDEDPNSKRDGEFHRIARPDGSEIVVECYGPADAPPLVMTHGWSCDGTEWFYEKKSLAGRYRLILWDEPGLGLSKKPDNNDYRLEKMAADLEAVLAFAGDRPAVLVGHSIGGMIILTLCKIVPEVVRTRVAGLVLAHTSYTNPVRTTKNGALLTAIEKPVLIPLLHLTIGTWPLVMLMNLLSYLNGSAQKSTDRQSFAGTETRAQLDWVAHFMATARPDVVARGMLGMIRYDATPVLATIPVPTLVVVGDQDITTLPEAGQFIA